MTLSISLLVLLDSYFIEGLLRREKERERERKKKEANAIYIKEKKMKSS